MPHEPLVRLLRDLVPSVASRAVVTVGVTALADTGEGPLGPALVRTAIPIDETSGTELVLWSEQPLAPLAASWARSVAAHVATLTALREAERRASAAEAAQDAMLTTIGHELRTPLQAITTLVHLLQVRVRATADELPLPWLRSRADQLERSVQRLLALSEALLDAAAAGHVVPGSPSQDLGALVDEVVEELDETPEAAAVIVRKHGDLSGDWNAFAVQRIVGNLVSNARKHGGGTPVVVALDGDDEDEVQILVQDGGDGVASGDRPHLFARFYRGRNATPGAGFGVGLWIVARTVDALGGTVTCEPGEERGATFKVRLPRRREAVSASSRAPS